MGEKKLLYLINLRSFGRANENCAASKILKTKTKEDKTFEYGLEDDREIIEYEKFIK